MGRVPLMTWDTLMGETLQSGQTPPGNPDFIEYLLEKQTAEGFWTIYYGGPGDLSTTIEAYFALKLSGYSEDHPCMVKARAFVLANGGIFKARVFTKIFLALFGEFSWLGVPPCLLN